ncbi:MAG TPA: hypothetical protein VJ508_20320, partial [Saprospiraceae bacterium]|nr:hypothetical protein [Saprospiraceae bacterium]
MDRIKSQRLLLKIQALLETNAGQELSRLEKDLLKSYILQLYEAVQDESALPSEPKSKMEESAMKSRIEPSKPEKPIVQITEPVVETPSVSIPEIKPVKPVDVPIEINYPKPDVVSVPKDETRTDIIREPVKEVVRTYAPPIVKDVRHEDALVNLFERQNADDMSGRFSHVPITDIESAMGLNERIFTLKELFGGDRSLFEATCAKLNNLHSFAEARTLLLNGPARDFKWGDIERIKMAEQFIRIVSRRYPKS